MDALLLKYTALDSIKLLLTTKISSYNSMIADLNSARYDKIWKIPQYDGVDSSFIRLPNYKVPNTITNPQDWLQQLSELVDKILDR